MAEIQISSSGTGPTCMHSINRITKLPVVETSIQTATNIYEKIRDYNGVTHWTFSTAENVVYKAVEVGKPITENLQGPIKKVDDVLCQGLDYVEIKVPAVMLPPGEIVCQIYTSTKEFVNQTVTPVVGAAYSFVEPAVKSAYEKVEPAVEKAKDFVDPLVQPALEKVQSLKQYGSHKLNELIHSHTHPEADLECEACQAVARNTENANQ